MYTFRKEKLQILIEMATFAKQNKRIITYLSTFEKINNLKTFSVSIQREQYTLARDSNRWFRDFPLRYRRNPKIICNKIIIFAQ